MRQFRVKTSTRLFHFGFLGLITALTVLGIFFAEPRLFFILFLLVLGWSWYQRLVKTALNVRVREDDSVEFESPLRRLTLMPGQIKEVLRVGGGYYVSSEAGSVSLHGNMEGVQDLLSHLRRGNPALEVKRYIPWGGTKGDG